MTTTTEILVFVVADIIPYCFRSQVLSGSVAFPFQCLLPLRVDVVQVLPRPFVSGWISSDRLMRVLIKRVLISFNVTRLISLILFSPIQRPKNKDDQGLFPQRLYLVRLCKIITFYCMAVLFFTSDCFTFNEQRNGFHMPCFMKDYFLVNQY